MPPREPHPHPEGAPSIDQLIKAQLPVIAHAARQGLGRQEGVKDVVQIVSTEMFLRLRDKRLTVDRELDSWTYTVAWRAGRRLRQQTGREELIEDDELAEVADAGRSPAEQAEIDDLCGHVQAVLDEMPADYRDVLWLHHGRQTPMPAVAAELGMPVSTSYTRLGKAQASFRKRWARRVPALATLIGLQAALKAHAAIPPAPPGLEEAIAKGISLAGVGAGAAGAAGGAAASAGASYGAGSAAGTIGGKAAVAKYVAVALAAALAGAAGGAALRSPAPRTEATPVGIVADRSPGRGAATPTEAADAGPSEATAPVPTAIANSSASASPSAAPSVDQAEVEAREARALDNARAAIERGDAATARRALNQVSRTGRYRAQRAVLEESVRAMSGVR
jgi:RNA polymerase sigma factor (sigma-70 family)